MRSIELGHLQWHWRTPNPVLKGCIYEVENLKKRCIYGQSYYRIQIGTIHNLLNGTTFDDLELPLTGISRSREENHLCIRWISLRCQDILVDQISNVTASSWLFSWKSKPLLLLVCPEEEGPAETSIRKRPLDTTNSLWHQEPFLLQMVQPCHAWKNRSWYTSSPSWLLPPHDDQQPEDGWTLHQMLQVAR